MGGYHWCKLIYLGWDGWTIIDCLHFYSTTFAVLARICWCNVSYYGTATALWRKAQSVQDDSGLGWQTSVGGQNHHPSEWLPCISVHLSRSDPTCKCVCALCGWMDDEHTHTGRCWAGGGLGVFAVAIRVLICRPVLHQSHRSSKQTPAE